ncbi:hypothetical protein MtrunA17_Chr5g0396641 [Medicago truncatula]|uniref:Uncharacterized protein n=1 Tax=Medicago truncatula TaxID=3880 RepID=G7K9C1_MEDTR|nr:uncharacterized protein LOC11427484 [Medicago truncatula]AES93946.1 hypothetical protein MTR_5g009260 [Medicago truncatula]RHN53512.1 hypothetical protein MtrunA17_Chr5g0396641 [Medicago truncatula]
MGNCMETYTMRPVEMEQQQKEETKSSINDTKGKNSVSMKVVLTKEELKWLIFQLNKKGGMKVEQVLEEIEKRRQKVEGWKPSLESILEAPEMLEIN